MFDGDPDERDVIKVLPPDYTLANYVRIGDEDGITGGKPEVTVRTWYYPSSQPYKCPVCEGRGRLPCGFYGYPTDAMFKDKDGPIGNPVNPAMAQG